MAHPSPTGTGGVFISYRREDTAYPAGWLYQQLRARLGSDEVFKDIDSIEPGDDFVDRITRAVGRCDILLALIGKEWSTVRDAAGARRLDDPKDFVRLEIEAALARDVKVIPLLLAGARMPKAEELPDSLAPLARRHAVELSAGRFEAETERLLALVERALAEVRIARGTGSDAHTVPPRRSGAKTLAGRRRRLAIVAGLATVALAGAGVWAWGLRDAVPSSSRWRLVIEDQAQGRDDGCTVTVTRTDTKETTTFPKLYKTWTFQFPDEGKWTWTASDPRCHVTSRSGPGRVTLPYSFTGLGDTDAFDTDGPITVEQQDADATTCAFELRSVKDGTVITAGAVHPGGGPVVVDPQGRSPVYIAGLQCKVKIVAAR